MKGGRVLRRWNFHFRVSFTPGRYLPAISLDRKLPCNEEKPTSFLTAYESLFGLKSWCQTEAVMPGWCHDARSWCTLLYDASDAVYLAEAYDHGIRIVFTPHLGALSWPVAKRLYVFFNENKTDKNEVNSTRIGTAHAWQYFYYSLCAVFI